MARKAGQIIAVERALGSSAFILGAIRRPGRAKYHNQDHSWSFSRSAAVLKSQACSNANNGRVSRAAVMSLNQLL